MARIRSDADVDLLVAIYARTSKRLERMLRQSIAAGATGTAAYRRQQLGAIRREMAKLERATPQLLDNAMRRSYLDGATIASGMLGADPMLTSAEGRFFGIHEPAIRAIAGEIDSRLALARQTIGRQVDDVFGRLGADAIAEGIAGGLSRREVSQGFVDELVKAGQTAFVDKRGARWSLDTYAETVARTATREAVTLGVVNRSLELGQDLVTISQHANACSICQPYEGRTYSITGRTEGYPRLEVAPPFHPRCRHVTTPATIFADPDPPPVEPENEPAPNDPVDAPAPVETPAPSGDLVRPTEAFDLRKSPRAARTHIEEHLAAIEDVHLMPEGFPLTEIKKTTDRRIGGKMTTDWNIVGQFKGAEIWINSQVVARVNSTAHEIGHLLDLFKFGAQNAASVDVTRSGVKVFYPSAHHDEFEAWRSAVEATSTFGDLAAARGGQSSYHRKWQEIWARCYEQWIATRSGNASLARKITEDNAAAARANRPYRKYWPDDEFVEIAAAMDDLFRSAGLLKPRG